MRGGDVCPHDGTLLIRPQGKGEAIHAPWLGRTIEDRYALFDVLGVGGFGAVYRAYDTQEDVDVAIKVVLASAQVLGADTMARFRQEAKLLASLTSPHIVEVLGFGEYENALYMVLELLPGVTLKEFLSSQPKLSLTTAVNITSQILHGLAAAHEQGLIHRDLKPANIMLDQTDGDRVKIIDFGIAKVLGARDGDAPKTGTGMVLGTVRYMAPEQLQQDGLDSLQTDLYSVGSIFYEMLCLENPYTGSPAEIAAAILYEDSPSLAAQGYSHALNLWFGRVMAKKPAHRYVDALTMQADLVQAVFDETITEQDNVYTQLNTNSLGTSRASNIEPVALLAEPVEDKAVLATDDQMHDEDTLYDVVDVAQLIGDLHPSLQGDTSQAEGDEETIGIQAGQTSTIEASSIPESGESFSLDVDSLFTASAHTSSSLIDEQAGLEPTQDFEPGIEDDDFGLPATERFSVNSSDLSGLLPPPISGFDSENEPPETVRWTSEAQSVEPQLASDEAASRQTVRRGKYWWAIPVLVLAALLAALVYMHRGGPTENAQSQQIECRYAQMPVRTANPLEHCLSAAHHSRNHAQPISGC